MENDIKVRFGIDSIDERKWAVSESMPESIDPDKLELRYLVETEIVRSTGKINVLTGVIYSMEGSTLCELVISASFSLDPFSDIIAVDDAKRTVSFSVEVIPTLLNITFGILRGVLFEKTKGTSLGVYPVPLISMPELVGMNRFKVEK